MIFTANSALRPVAGPLGRSALGGRNWEGFSPDPYLTGVAFSQTIVGAQSQKIQGMLNLRSYFIGLTNFQLSTDPISLRQTLYRI
jgi:hypothetical protein